MYDRIVLIKKVEQNFVYIFTERCIVTSNNLDPENHSDVIEYEWNDTTDDTHFTPHQHPVPS